VSNTPDPSVIRHLDGTDFDGTDLTSADLRIIRRLQPSQQEPSPDCTRGYIEAGWLMPDGAAVRGLLVLVPDANVTPAE
jgi:hypothetical protein